MIGLTRPSWRVLKRALPFARTVAALGVTFCAARAPRAFAPYRGFLKLFAVLNMIIGVLITSSYFRGRR